MTIRTAWKYCLLACLLAACSTAPVSYDTEPSRAPGDIAAPASADRGISATAQSKSFTAQRAAAPQSPRADERLGTQWGDTITSAVTEVDLRRKSSTPLDENSLRYADKAYRGQPVQSIALLAGKISLSVIDDRRDPLPLYRDNGQYYLQGQNGQAYRLQYHNHSDNTYEIVASVDGLDVLTGKAASRTQGGYVLNPQDTLIIAGFRRDMKSVASFIFSKPGDAYAANTPAGSIGNTGIIGTVVYELQVPPRAVEKRREPQPINQPDAFPADSRFAPPPR